MPCWARLPGQSSPRSIRAARAAPTTGPPKATTGGPIPPIPPGRISNATGCRTRPTLPPTGKSLLGFARTFDALAAAYRLTGDERYAAAAVRHLDAWFVNPATMMNPNLQFAQAVRGRSTGRGTGLIDTVHLAEVARGIEALRGSRALAPAEDAAVCAWFRSYLLWMRTSPNGLEEGKAPNNHGTCWVLQAAAFAHLIGDRDEMADCRRRLLEDLIPGQMDPDGSFPLELARTKPYGYSIFNLDVMTALAQLLSGPGENLLSRALPDGRSLLKAIDYLAPSLADKSHWPKPPDAMYWNDWPVRQPALLFGALAAGRRDWLEIWERLDPDPVVAEIQRNYPIRQPVLWMEREARTEARLTLNFDPDWRFLKADPAGASSPGFDDSGWKRVSLPHTYNDTDAFAHWSDRTMAGEKGLWSGRTWYRKSFSAPPSWTGRRVIVEFEAVRQVGEVYLNGHYLGVCKNGFVPFAFDLTPFMRADGGENILAVMCDNRFMSDPSGESSLASISAATTPATAPIPAPSLMLFSTEAHDVNRHITNIDINVRFICPPSATAFLLRREVSFQASSRGIY